MLDVQEFRKLLHRLFCAFPSSLRDGSILPQVQQAYWDVLKNQRIEDMTKAVTTAAQQGGDFVPSAAMILSWSKKHAIDREPINYHKEKPALPQPNHKTMQIANGVKGDGLPPDSRSMPPGHSRRASDYSEAAHDATDHFLNLIRAMKFKGLPGGEMADKFINEMQKQGPIKSQAPARYQERVRTGCIPNAADSTCADFADILSRIEAGELRGDREPDDIGGRLFWTFSGRQKQHIVQKIAAARARRERREADEKEREKSRTSTDMVDRPVQFKVKNHHLNKNETGTNRSIKCR